MVISQDETWKGGEEEGERGQKRNMRGTGQFGGGEGEYWAEVLFLSVTKCGRKVYCHWLSGCHFSDLMWTNAISPVLIPILRDSCLQVHVQAPRAAAVDSGLDAHTGFRGAECGAQPELAGKLVWHPWSSACNEGQVFPKA